MADSTEDKAAVISGAEEEAGAMLPTSDDEAAALAAEEPRVEISAKETKIDIGKKEDETEVSQGLTKEELMKFATDPYWVRMRWVLFILFWVIWVAMLVASVVIIIYAPKCPSPEPKGWWQKSPLYNVDMESSGATFAEIETKLNYLVGTGVSTLYLSSLFETSAQAVGTEGTDFNPFDQKFGSLEDWKSLVAALSARDQKVVIDFIPNHSTDDHWWFKKSEASYNDFKDFYVWRDGSAGTPPNDWKSSSGDSVWTHSTTRNAWYLHKLGANKPDLNLENPAVQAELERILNFWIERGVNGFVVKDTPFFDDESSDRAISAGTKEIIRRLRATTDTSTEETGVPCVLYADVREYPDLGASLYGTQLLENNVGDLIHLPLYNTIMKWDHLITATQLKEDIDLFFEALPENAWPSLTFQAKGGNPKQTDAITMLKMVLPGTGLTLAGEEMGGLSDPKRWMGAVASEQESNPHQQLYSTLANKLRHQEAILYGQMGRDTTFVLAGSVFGLTRVKKGNPGYLLAINLGPEDKMVDMSGLPHLPDSIRLMAKSVNQDDGEGVVTKRFESMNVTMNANESKLFTFVPKFGA